MGKVQKEAKYLIFSVFKEIKTQLRTGEQKVVEVT